MKEKRALINGTKERRAFLRFFVCSEDWTHHSPDDPLPEAVTTGEDPFLVIGAIAGDKKEG